MCDVRLDRARRSRADLAPAPGPNEFDADQEQAMRQGERQANMAPPAGEPDGDEGMGGLGRRGPWGAIAPDDLLQSSPRAYGS